MQVFQILLPWLASVTEDPSVETMSAYKSLLALLEDQLTEVEYYALLRVLDREDFSGAPEAQQKMILPLLQMVMRLPSRRRKEPPEYTQVDSMLFLKSVMF